MNSSPSLKRTVISAIGWASATRFIAQLLNWAMTFFVVRLLTPDDYGLMAITMAVGGFLQSLSYTGLSDAIVQNIHLTEDDLRDIFGLIIVVNMAFLVLLCAISYPVAWFYDEPRLTPLLQAASLIFPFIALLAIPQAKLAQGLDLKRMARVEVASSLLSGASVIVLAWGGAGVWSLLLGMLINTALHALGYSVLSPFLKRPRFRFATHGHIIRFGGIRSIENMLWYIYTNADIFLVGKLLGPHVLGTYSIASYIARLPADKLAPVIKPVAFPAFVRLQGAADQAVRYLCKAIQALAFIGFPLLFGISAIAGEIVELVLGSEWNSVAAPLRLLAIAMVLRLISLVINSFLVGLGKIRESFRNTLFATILFPTAFALGSHWGIEGVCVAWLVAAPIHFLNLIRRVHQVTGVSIAILLRPLLEPFAGAALMYAIVTGVRSVLPDNLSLVSTTAILVGAGSACYGAFTLALCRPMLAELFSLLRSQKTSGPSK